MSQSQLSTPIDSRTAAQSIVPTDRARLDRVQATYEAAAQILGRSEAPEDRRLAAVVERFSVGLTETRT